MKRKMIGAALGLLLMMTSGVALAETCEEAMASYAKQVAEDNAADTSKWGPGVKETIDKSNKRIKANILKGCAPGGFYEQLDEALRIIRAECKAHPNKQGC